MDKKFRSTDIFSRLALPEGELRKPFSQFPQRRQHNPNDYSRPLNNFQMIPNDSKGEGRKKRKLDHSSFSTDGSSVLKKPCRLNALSPDLGCFVDFSSPLSGSASLFVSPHFPANDSAHSSRLDVEHEKRGPFGDQADSTSVSRSQLEPVKPAVEYLEGEDDVLIIGEPIFESSVCQPSAAEEQRSCLSDRWASTVDTSYETTLPLQVQVKSKVVVPNPPEGINKPASSQMQNSYCANNQSRNKTRSQRFVYNNEMEWERRKSQYVFSVKSHMAENYQVANQGYMTELQDLMTHVAGQTGSNGSGWQHPSDLTCRNYQWRWDNGTPSMTLSEWQAKNLTNHKRFCKLPKF